MPAKLGKTSLKKLDDATDGMRRVVLRAEKISPYDFTVLEVLRSTKRQQSLFAMGPHVTTRDGVIKKSKHQANKDGYSEAVDVAPWPIDWQDHRLFYVLAGIMFAAAAIEKVKIRWGGDWNSNGDLDDQKLKDLPHFEEVK